MRAIQDHYRELSEHYDDQRSNRYFRLVEQLELAVLQRYAGPAVGRILEIGCGTGIFLKHLERSSWTLYGIDYTRRMLDHAQCKLDRQTVGLVQGDAQALPYASHSFELVFSFKVLPHVPPLDRALAEVRRVLAPGGVAVLEFYNRHSVRHLFRRPGTYQQWHSPAEVRQLLDSADLSLVATYGARIATPFAAALDIPLVRQVLEASERALSRTALNRFAGYYITVCRPRGG